MSKGAGSVQLGWATLTSYITINQFGWGKKIEFWKQKKTLTIVLKIRITNENAKGHQIITLKERIGYYNFGISVANKERKTCSVCICGGRKRIGGFSLKKVSRLL